MNSSNVREIEYVSVYDFPYPTKLSGCSTFQLKNGSDSVPCIKRVSYIDIGRIVDGSKCTVGSAIPSKPRSKSHGPIFVSGNLSNDTAEGLRREWDGRYRFFSRPFNLSDHACSASDSLRMRESFGRHCRSETRTDSIEMLDNENISDTRQKRMIEGRMRDCGELVELSRETAQKRGRSSSHAGYDWPKYKFFSSGMNVPNIGAHDKLLLINA